MQSSGQLNCSAFDKVKKTVVRGNYKCVGLQAKPGGQGSKTSGGSGSSPTGTGAASHVTVSFASAMGGTGLVAALLHFLL